MLDLYTGLYLLVLGVAILKRKGLGDCAKLMHESHENAHVIYFLGVYSAYSYWKVCRKNNKKERTFLRPYFFVLY